MRRALLAACAAALLAGCGDDGGGGGAPPQGPPAERHGQAPIVQLVTVEVIRSRLTASSDLYGIGGRAAARHQLRSARSVWEGVSGRVRRGDRVLEREVSAGFGLVEGLMAGDSTFDDVRDRLAPLGGQLMDGVREELAPKDARLDPGVQAAVLLSLAKLAQDEYARGTPEARQRAFGLVVRSQAVARDIADELGPQRDVVVDGLKELRAVVFPEGAALPSPNAPPAAVAERLNRVGRGLAERFGLT